jgi:hypothetical protein
MTVVRHIFRWDLDKTYLRSDFESVRELVRTARKTAEERENIPGSAALIRGIRDGAPSGEKHLIFFVSGSPEQLRGVIERKFALDGFAPDGFEMKATVSEIIRGRFRVIRNQIPYKLVALLRGRSDAPIGTHETLIGDDAESDALIYSLYADLLSGKIPESLLPTILRRAGAYEDQIRAIMHHAGAVIHEPAVRRIIIHLDQHTPPAAFYDFAPLAVPIYNHLQTALQLNLDATLPASVVFDVAAELIGAYGFDVQKLVNSGEDLLRRRRAHHSPEALELLAKALVELPDEPDEQPRARAGSVLRAPPPPDPEARRAARQVILRLADRALYIQSRPMPNVEAPPPFSRNYLALLDRDVTRRLAAKRAKKIAARMSEEDLSQALEPGLLADQDQDLG